MIKQPLACVKENVTNAQWIKAQSKSILCDQVPSRVKYKNNQYSEAQEVTALMIPCD